MENQTSEQQQQPQQPEDNQGIRVFVYGTLKRGHSNHYLIKDGKDSKFLGREILEGPYTMLDLRYYPGVIRQDSNSSLSRRIYGEVYRISEETLEVLDTLEGNGRFFTRRQIPTRFKKAWAYFIPEAYLQNGKDIIQGGCWRPLEDEKEFFEFIEKAEDGLSKEAK